LETAKPESGFCTGTIWSTNSWSPS